MLPAVVLTAMHSLEAAGFEVFAVGGWRPRYSTENTCRTTGI